MKTQRQMLLKPIDALLLIAGDQNQDQSLSGGWFNQPPVYKHDAAESLFMKPRQSLQNA